MPPKKAKGKKKTKAELEAEKKAREEEEQRLRDEEERLEAERLAREREEEERALAERVSARNDEIKRFMKNMKDFSVLRSSRDARLFRERNALERDAEWRNFVRCNDASWPDADSISLNTYISQIEEGSEFTIADVAECLGNIQRVLIELESDLLDGARESQPGAQESADQRIQAFSERLQLALAKLIDSETGKIMDRFGNDRHRAAADESETLSLVHGPSYGGVAIWANLKKKNTKKRVDLTEALGVAIDIPKALAGGDIGLRVCRFPFDVAPYERYSGGDVCLGGSLRIDVLTLPAPAKKIEEWSIRETGAVQSAQDTTRRGNISDRAPMKCHVRLPDHVVFCEETCIAAKWEGGDECWSCADVAESSYDAATRTVSFQLSTPGVIGIIQSRQRDFFYKDWSLGPLMIDGCDDPIVQYKLTTPRFDIIIRVKGSTCTLIGPDINELSAVRDIPLAPGELLATLSRSGIHLMPSDSDAGKMERTLNMKEIEERMCLDVAYLSTAYQVRSSRFNVDLGRTCACYEVRESDAFTGGPGRDPSKMHMGLVDIDIEHHVPGANKLPPECGNVRCSIVKGVKEGKGDDGVEMLNLSAKDGTQSCLFISQCLVPLSSPEALERIESASPLVTDAVRQLLELTRPFNFC